MCPRGQEFNYVYTGQQQFLFSEDVCVCVCVCWGGVTKPTFMCMSLACAWPAPDPVWTENAEPARDLRAGCSLSLALSGS